MKQKITTDYIKYYIKCIAFKFKDGNLNKLRSATLNCMRAVALRSNQRFINISNTFYRYAKCILIANLFYDFNLVLLKLTTVTFKILLILPVICIDLRSFDIIFRIITDIL